MRKILIVDDDKKSVAALAIRLTTAGYKVLFAFDGIAGLKLAVHHRPDLILMDIWMPGGVGILTLSASNISAWRCARDLSDCQQEGGSLAILEEVSLLRSLKSPMTRTNSSTALRSCSLALAH